VKRGHLIVLIFILAATLVVGALLLWQVSKDTQATAAGYKTTWNGLAPPTAFVDAESRAAERVADWTLDAQLFKAEATWRPPADMVTVERLPVAWSFYYHSASRSKFVVVTVNGDKVFWTPPVSFAKAPAALDDFPPAQGPEDAWLRFREAGGEAYLRDHAAALVKYQLRETSQGQQWTVIAITDGESLKVNVDAQTGLVIDEN